MLGYITDTRTLNDRYAYPQNKNAAGDCVWSQPTEVCASTKSRAWIEPRLCAESFISKLYLYPFRIQFKQKPPPADTRNKWSCARKHGKNMEGHRELLPPKPNMLAAPESSNGAYFWLLEKQRVLLVKKLNLGDFCHINSS